MKTSSGRENEVLHAPQEGILVHPNIGYIGRAAL